MKNIFTILIVVTLAFKSAAPLTKSIHILAKECVHSNTIDLVILCGEKHHHGSFANNRKQFNLFQQLFALDNEKTCVLIENMHDTSFWFQTNHAKKLAAEYLERFKQFSFKKNNPYATYDVMDFVGQSKIPARIINIECRQALTKYFENMHHLNEFPQNMKLRDIFEPRLSLTHYAQSTNNKPLKTIFENIRNNINKKIKLFKMTLDYYGLNYHLIESKSFYDIKKYHFAKLEQFTKKYLTTLDPLEEMIEANALFYITRPEYHYHTTFVFAGGWHHQHEENRELGLLPYLQKVGYTLLKTKKYYDNDESLQIPQLAYKFMSKSQNKLRKLMLKK